MYQYDENGVLKSMEVHARMDGLVAGFDCQVLVQETGGMWSEGWSQNFALLKGASTCHIRAVFIDPVPKLRHRIIVNLIHNHFHPGLTHDERLLAARDIVFEAPRGLSPHRSTFV